MRNVKIMILVMMSTFIANSCSDDDDAVTRSDSDSRIETLIFGRYFGECEGNACVEIFRLQDGVLQEDMSDEIPFRGYFFIGDFTDFKGATKIKSDELLSEFPLELLREKSDFHTIGQPNSGDWGNVYLEYKKNDIHKQFVIDNNTNNLPSYLVKYVKKIEETINEVSKINSDY